MTGFGPAALSMAVVDFEAAVRDPNHPGHFPARYEPGDHLHPNDAGYKVMGDAIDLKLFTIKPSNRNGPKLS